MMIKFGYFFNHLSEPRLGSDPKKPFSQTQINSLPTAPTPSSLHSVSSSPPVPLWIASALKYFSETQMFSRLSVEKELPNK